MLSILLPFNHLFVNNLQLSYHLNYDSSNFTAATSNILCLGISTFIYMNKYTSVYKSIKGYIIKGLTNK